MGTAFGLDWQLHGLWTGVAIALFLVALVEYTFIYRFDVSDVSCVRTFYTRYLGSFGGILASKALKAVFKKTKLLTSCS